MQEKKLNTNYQPGRTPEELQCQQIRERLSHTPTQSFRIMIDLIRIAEKMKNAKITHVDE